MDRLACATGVQAQMLILGTLFSTSLVYQPASFASCTRGIGCWCLLLVPLDTYLGRCAPRDEPSLVFVMVEGKNSRESSNSFALDEVIEI